MFYSHGTSMTVGKTYVVLCWIAIPILGLAFFLPNGPFQTWILEKDAELQARKAASPTGHLCSLCGRPAVYFRSYARGRSENATPYVDVWFCGECQPSASTTSIHVKLNSDDSKGWMYNLAAGLVLLGLSWSVNKTQEVFMQRRPRLGGSTLVSLCLGMASILAALFYCLGIWR